MAERTSTLQKALEVVEALSPDEQAILVDIIHKRLQQQHRQQLLQEVAEAERPTFIRAFKRLVRQNPLLRPQIERALQQLAEDPFHPSLRTHKLQG